MRGGGRARGDVHRQVVAVEEILNREGLAVVAVDEFAGFVNRATHRIGVRVEADELIHRALLNAEAMQQADRRQLAAAGEEHFIAAAESSL